VILGSDDPGALAEFPRLVAQAAASRRACAEAMGAECGTGGGYGCAGPRRNRAGNGTYPRAQDGQVSFAMQGFTLRQSVRCSDEAPPLVGGYSTQIRHGFPGGRPIRVASLPAAWFAARRKFEVRGGPKSALREAEEAPNAGVPADVDRASALLAQTWLMARAGGFIGSLATNNGRSIAELQGVVGPQGVVGKVFHDVSGDAYYPCPWFALFPWGGVDYRLHRPMGLHPHAGWDMAWLEEVCTSGPRGPQHCADWGMTRMVPKRTKLP
jgi:hypothetical protein